MNVLLKTRGSKSCGSLRNALDLRLEVTEKTSAAKPIPIRTADDKTSEGSMLRMSNTHPPTYEIDEGKPNLNA